jgi:hypothetical protein
MKRAVENARKIHQKMLMGSPIVAEESTSFLRLCVLQKTALAGH